MESGKQTQALLIDRMKELEPFSREDLQKALAELEKNKETIIGSQELYYNAVKDGKERDHYYRSILKLRSSSHPFSKYHELLKRTHTSIPYFMSKDQYLYTWVDIQPDGSIKNIYSGVHQDPKALIKEDFLTIQKKYIEFQQLLHKNNNIKELRNEKISKIDFDLKFNTEHIVPQSWYGAEEPMKGDLHHLFACQPECNIKRSNFPYADFVFYKPESPDEKIKNHCGITMEGRFEPEYGKGTVARAMLYFLVRYPRAIKKSFKRQIDLSLLIRWHQQFEVTIYEKHRNQAIYLIQGNRNPFIDFPELAEQINLKNNK